VAEQALERSQRKAAEHVLEDEAWRDALTDDVATRLLEWALQLTDAALGRVAAGGFGAGLEDAAHDVAGQTRALLAALAPRWRGATEDQVWDALAPLLGPPLFSTADEGRRAVGKALAAARPADDGHRRPGDEHAPPDGNDAGSEHE
jgi:hypothetical protein